MKKLRISAISFLNTAPLMWDFEHPGSTKRDLQAEFDISYTVPSACADALRKPSCYSLEGQQEHAAESPAGRQLS